MSAKSRIIELNSRIKKWLTKRGVDVQDNETTTSLVQRISDTPLTFNHMSLLPVSSNTVAVDWSGSPGTTLTFKEDGRVYFKSLVDGYPHITTTYNTTMQIPYLKLFVDAAYTEKFNMMIHYNGVADGVSRQLRLSDLVRNTSNDFHDESCRATFMADFGSYIVANTDHINPPMVNKKYDILEKATGQNKNFVFIPSSADIGGQHSFGSNGASNKYLMGDDVIDLNETPYLYYSIDQAEESGCTFAIYTTDTTYDGNNTMRPENDSYSAWYMYRDNTYKDGDLFLRGGANYEQKSKNSWMYGSQTGCIDLRKYVSNDKKSKFKITELKLYGYASNSTTGKTECTFNYLFIGSKPTNTFVQGQWGEPAYLTESSSGTTNYKNVYHGHAARGGPINLKTIDYYVVGEPNDAVELRAVAIARPYQYKEEGIS